MSDALEKSPLPSMSRISRSFGAQQALVIRNMVGREIDASARETAALSAEPPILELADVSVSPAGKGGRPLVEVAPPVTSGMRPNAASEAATDFDADARDFSGMILSTGAARRGGHEIGGTDGRRNP